MTGKSEPKKGTTYDESPKTALPWYKELAYSFKQADRSDPVKADSTKQSQHAGEEDKQDSQQQTGQSQQDGQQPSEEADRSDMDMTIIEQAKGLADKVLAQPATEHDIAVVERQLGRYPRGMVAVGARCVCGRPLAVVTRPLLPGGVPFPTTCYLTGPKR